MAANVNSSIAYYPNNGFVPNSVLRANSGSPVVGYVTPGNLTPGRCSTPVPSGRCSTPVSLGRCSTPVSSGRCSTPVSSGRCSTPVSSGRCSTPVSFVTRKYYSDIIAASTASTVAIDNKIEQAMDLVKSHLMFAVREEVDVLKDRIVELMDRIKHLECENTILRQYASPEVLQQLQSQMPHQMQQPPHHSSTS